MTGTFEEQFTLFSKALESESGGVELLSRSFRELKNDYGRINFVYELIESHKFFPVIHKTPQKDDEKSNLSRVEGNRAYSKGNYYGALTSYNTSLCLALPNSRNYALALANRSATLQRVQEFDLAILDIKRALVAEYPLELHHKLYERAAQCHLGKNQPNAANNYLETAINHLHYVSDKIRETVLKNKYKETIQNCCCETIDINVEESPTNFPKVADEPHSNYTSLSRICEVVENNEDGRYIKAVQTIKPGEIILVERPYASVVLPHHLLTHCQFCYKFLIAPLYCEVCSHVAFCSEECKSKSSFHQFECSLLTHLLKLLFDKNSLLALRIVTESPTKILKYFSNPDINHCDDVDIETCSSLMNNEKTKNGIYSCDDYCRVSQLVKHSSRRTTADYFKRTFKAIFLATCLCSSQHFPIDVKKAALCILWHLQSIPCNAHEISEFVVRSKFVQSSLSGIGAGLFATLSLFNHSCDPSVVRTFYGNMCVVRSLKNILPGEPVSDNYGVIYATHAKPDRIEMLRSQYFFSCSCTACTHDYPLYGDLPSETENWKCPLCKIAITECGCSTDEELFKKMKEKYQKSLAVYSKALINLINGRTSNVLPILLDHIAILEKSVVKPWKGYNDCQEGIKQCFNLTASKRAELPWALDYKCESE